MKVLFVIGGKTSSLHKKEDNSEISFYIKEQSDELRKLGVQIDIFRFNLNGKLNLIKKIKQLRKVLAVNSYDLIHAHYGLFGFATLFAKSKTPLVTTFHGSDINVKKNKWFSALAIKYSNYSIFVSQALYENALIKPKNNFRILPCGVDHNIFYTIEKNQARKMLGYNNEVYVLFPSSRKNPIKNFSLANESLNKLSFKYNVVELIKKSREEVNMIMNACDLLLLTSNSEGSPQVIKEALSTNLPIVSVDVGDVYENIKEIKNCYIANNNPFDIAEKMKLIINNGSKRSDGNKLSHKFENKNIAKEILVVYNILINKCG